MIHSQDAVFSYLRVDDQPAYLEATYKMRYSVYCREKHFLNEDDYPDRLETDEYDRCSLHFAAINEEGLIKGTVRVVTPPDGNFPLLQHCVLDQSVPPPYG